MSINLEKFPNSDAAKRMLSYVTQHWYDRSYVGKWTYEVMGRELDRAIGYIEELPYQYFIDTATWGLMYHEMKYGLPVREDLGYEERRRIIRERKDTKAPMTPWRMEQIIRASTGFEVHIYDCNDEGHTDLEPNLFEVHVVADDQLNIGNVLEKIRTLKQSHTSFSLNIVQNTRVDTYVASQISMVPTLTILCEKPDDMYIQHADAFKLL